MRLHTLCLLAGLATACGPSPSSAVDAGDNGGKHWDSGLIPSADAGLSGDAGMTTDAGASLDAGVPYTGWVRDADCPQPREISSGAFRKLYDPSVGESSAWYLNDHTFIRGKDGTWHLFGITHAEPANPLDEKQFAHATSRSLTDGPWQKQPPALVANPAFGEQLLWAPYVMEHDGLYYMFYCAGGDHTQYAIRLATSPDLVNWTRHPPALFTDGFDARDPYVINLNGTWVMYYTANSAPAGGNHIVAYRTSTDLKTWSARNVAYVDPEVGTFAGPTESPFVVPLDGSYYLFIGPRPGYVGTDVFRSDNPFKFDVSNKVGHVASHAAEVVRDTDGSYYVSAAGWGQGGVYLAPLTFAQTRCVSVERPAYRTLIQTAPRSRVLSLAYSFGGAMRRELLKDQSRGNMPYLAIGGWGASALPGTPATIELEEKKLILREVPVGAQPATLDWAFCFDETGFSQGVKWHVKSALPSVWEVAMSAEFTPARVGDPANLNRATGDVAGFGPWMLASDATASIAMAYRSGSAFGEANRWYGDNSVVSWQPFWRGGGAAIAPGDYPGGVWRFAASAKANDRALADAAAAELTNSAPCLP